MTRQLDVYALPILARDLPEDGVSVAIDVLRATTTITTALANGAARVLPFESIGETLAAKSAISKKRPEDADALLPDAAAELDPLPPQAASTRQHAHSMAAHINARILFMGVLSLVFLPCA